MVRACRVPPRQTVIGFLCLLFVLIIPTVETCSAEIIGRVPRVLILYPYDERLPATTFAGETARARLLESTEGLVDPFSEFLDLSRFPEKVHIDRMARYLGEKYQERRPDVVIAIGEEATSFIIKYRNAIAPEAKIVFSGFSGADAAKMKLPDDVFGAFSDYDIAKTLAMARRLQPDARELFIIGGSAPFDRSWIATARKDLAGAAGGLKLTYFEDLTIDEFVDRASRVPAGSIILVLTILSDRSGRNFIPRDALERIAGKANAPVYGPYATYIGHGAVGGNTVTFESMGAAVAELAVAAIAGKPIASVKVPQTYVADARQLKRWGLPESALPSGTVQSFKEKSLWEQYWPAIVGIVAALALQAVIITGLLVERHRRRGAEQESRLRLLELVHLNQSATAGALSASIAHELSQPLGAIRSNVETAQALLWNMNPNIDLVQQILADIRDDDQRASDIIVRLRGLLKKRSEIDWQEFDLNDVISSAIQILHAEAEQKRVVVSSKQPARKLPVRADKVHLQQVILNLATNAIDAMVDAATTHRELVFQTALMEESKVVLSISDTGRGIPRDQLDSVFNAFYTTKPAGTGLGLSIARAIIETYGGKIWADNRAEGGAVFRFVLPLAQHG
ncbi:sensor histidine kinase [Sinorhizobium medicae]|uniref:sensor histidine kinase n=1 Tax=Sinorhizobium medicae TaxID=110321 RepID=UPI000FD29C99|nr:sensor histidine kinase [Sinorhizobium medicae]RVJ63779.1 sensor histidine kinase [Sinorhizobium medicae]